MAAIDWDLIGGLLILALLIVFFVGWGRAIRREELEKHGMSSPRVKLYDSLRRWRTHKKSRRRIEHLLALSADHGPAIPTTTKEDALSVVRSCRDRSETIGTYRSHAIWRDVSDRPVIEEVLHLHLEAIRPDRFHFWQSTWMDKEDPREVYDEWITLCEDHYDNVGLWGKSLTPERQEQNRGHCCIV